MTTKIETNDIEIPKSPVEVEKQEGVSHDSQEENVEQEIAKIVETEASQEARETLDLIEQPSAIIDPEHLEEYQERMGALKNETNEAAESFLRNIRSYGVSNPSNVERMSYPEAYGTPTNSVSKGLKEETISSIQGIGGKQEAVKSRDEGIEITDKYGEKLDINLDVKEQVYDEAFKDSGFQENFKNEDVYQNFKHFVTGDFTPEELDYLKKNIVPILKGENPNWVKIREIVASKEKEKEDEIQAAKLLLRLFIKTGTYVTKKIANQLKKDKETAMVGDVLSDAAGFVEKTSDKLLKSGANKPDFSPELINEVRNTVREELNKRSAIEKPDEDVEQIEI